MVSVDTWYGCYRYGWQGVITPASFAHPAKYSRSLIQRIYEHARDQGWLHAGETVADPFGGVALGALDAMLMGCHWLGMELEPRFVQLAQDNLNLWWQRYSHLPTIGTVGIIQGDSRQCAAVLAPYIACVCSSPPYNLPMSQDHNGTRGGQRGSTPSEGGAFHVYGTTRGQLEGLPPGDLATVITSPPYANGLGKEETYADHAKREKDSHRGIMREKGIADPYYGTHPAQLGNLPPGKVAAALAADCTISSPPWMDARQETTPSHKGVSAPTQHDPEAFGRTLGQLATLPAGSLDLALSSPPYADGCAHTGGADPQPQYVQGGTVHHVAYGTQPGQLGALPTGAVEACISSPPWDGGSPALMPERQRISSSPLDHGGPGPQYQAMPTLGEPDTFWSAARMIVQQVFALLKPGGHALWVVKSYVRDKEIVDFPGDWRRLCESLGFVTLHEHHALLVEENGTQGGLFGEDTTHRTQRKSFFRRLAEKNGSPPIDWETIYCMVKPHGATTGRLHACIASPPYVQSVHDGNGIDQAKLTGNRPGSHTQATAEGYGRSAGQLGAMPPGPTP